MYAAYVVGLLQIENWKKTGYPLLSSRSIKGEFGTGHNAYVIDVDGEPVLDLTEENDVLKEFRKVELELEIQ